MKQKYKCQKRCSKLDPNFLLNRETFVLEMQNKDFSRNVCSCQTYSFSITIWLKSYESKTFPTKPSCKNRWGIRVYYKCQMCKTGGGTKENTSC